VSILEYRSLFS